MRRGPLLGARLTWNWAHVRGSILTRNEWLAAMKVVAARVDDARDEAIAVLRDLVSRAAEARDRTVTSWHVLQSQGLLAQLEHQRGSAAAAAEINEQAAHDAYADFREARHSAGELFAQAALQRFELGETDRAMALAEQACALVEVYQDPSITYERLVAEVRHVRQTTPDGSWPAKG